MSSLALSLGLGGLGAPPTLPISPVFKDTLEFGLQMSRVGLVGRAETVHLFTHNPVYPLWTDTEEGPCWAQAENNEKAELEPVDKTKTTMLVYLLVCQLLYLQFPPQSSISEGGRGRREHWYRPRRGSWTQFKTSI